jgi:hypothetical protein
MSRITRRLASAFNDAAAIAAIMVAIQTGTAQADPNALARPFPAISELRLGVFAANLDGRREDADVLVNGELLFAPLITPQADPILDILLRPRPHIGASIAANGGTNQTYAGFTWEVPLTSRLFIEGGLGVAVHDGPTGDDPSYGCAALFRESASLGYELSDDVRLLLTVDHISNAGLCESNQGLTNAGVRLGYRW